MMCAAYRYLLQYQEPIPCEQLVTALCDIKQAYTQFGGTKQHHDDFISGFSKSIQAQPILCVINTVG